ncbi:hypothetical protein Tco_0066315 [Tanacetum coccineum]
MGTDSTIRFQREKTTREEGQHGISAATGISDLEQVLQQKTFTRSNESSSRANLYSSPSSKVALRQDLVLHNNATGFLKSPNTLIAPKIANGFTTPRSRGRPAMYSMARTPYATSPSTFTRKGITSSYGREEALTSSRSTFQHGGKMCFHALCHALKRRSSVLDDDIGSGGSLRRTRQKANLALKRKSSGAEKKRDTSMHGSGSVSGYANVPTKSTQTATKILQHLEEVDLKEKSSGSTKSPPDTDVNIAHSRELDSKARKKHRCKYIIGNPSKDGKWNDEKPANIFGNLDAPAFTALPGTPTNGISTTTTRTLAAIFSTSTPTPVIPSSVPTLVFGFGFATSTTPTISVAETGNTSVTNDKDLKSNSPFTSTPFSTTTTTTGSGLLGSSSLAVTSTTNNQSLASFFNVSNGSQANTQASVAVAVTPSVPSLFGSGTTSIPSSTSGTSPFSSSAFTIGTSSSFGISSMTTSSEGKYGNSTSGPATSIFGSTWDPAKSSRFYNFGVSATPTPSGTTSIPSSTSGTSHFSSSAFTIGTSSSFSISSMTASSEGKYGNSTSGPATSIFGSTWDPTKSFRFGTTYNFGASATPTPSATTSPVVFGASSTRGSTKYSFGAGAGPPSSFSTPTQNQSPLTPVFGNSTSGPATSIFWSTWDPEKSSGFGTNHMSMDGMEEDSMQTPTPVFDTSVDSMVAEDSHVFGTGATTNNYDDMSMDGMVEDCMQTPTPVPAFGQTSVALPPFTFDSGTQPPFVQLCPHPDWWPAKTNW